MHNSKHIPVAISLLILWGLFTCEPVVAQNAPVSTIGAVNSYSNTATVPVNASNISNVGSFSLKIVYDQAIVQPVAVTASPVIGGSLSVNLINPGFILLSWYTFPGLTLGGNPVILDIDFTRVAIGTSSLTFLDDGYSCAWYDVNAVSLNDVPTSAYYLNGSVSFLSPDAPHTILPAVGACQGTLISMPVKITGFNNIGKVYLTLNYSLTAFWYQSYTNTSGFPGLTVDGTLPGTLLISGTMPPGGTGFSLSDSSVLLTLNFSFSGGAAGLMWYDNGVSCQYSGPPPSYFILNDTPQGTFYFNGAVAEIPMPGAAGAITGPPGGNGCPGQSGVNFSISPVQNATGYVWSLPPGSVITSGASTNNIWVTFGNSPGNWDVTVYGSNSCGNGLVSPAFPVFINELPSITLQPVSPATVKAGAGSASFYVGASGSVLNYQWQESPPSWTSLSDGGVYSGVFTATLTITDPPASMDGNHYRCVVSGICPPQVVSDGEARLSVSTVTGTGGNALEENKSLKLSVFPNPVIGDATLSYYLPADGYVMLEIRNMYGKMTNILLTGYEPRGTHKLRTPLQLNSGLYIVTLSLQTAAEENISSEKIIVN